jgi:type I restriction enzyme R subunit
MLHNENSRVKIPALIHFTRLGYEYLSLKEYDGFLDEKTNIFVDIFHKCINRINNTTFSAEEAQAVVNELAVILDSDDLGRAFYKVLLNGINGIKLIDFTNHENNTYQIVTELTYALYLGVDL